VGAAGGTVFEVADGISNLLSKSLLTLEGSAPAGHWRLLETVRAYALEKLTETGEVRQAARRHAEFFREVVAPDAIGPQLQPPVQALTRYVKEIGNVRAALDWCFSTVGDSRIGVVLTAAYVPVWIHLAFMIECRERAERALASLQPETIPSPRLKMQVYIALGGALVYTMGSAARAGIVLIEALELAESLDDVDGQLQALWALWALRLNTGDCRGAQSAGEQFSRIAMRTGEPEDFLVADRMLGFALHYQGNQPEARLCLERVLEHYVATKQTRRTIWFLDLRVLVRAMLARVLCVQGIVDEAVSHVRASIEEAQAMDHKHTTCEVLRLAACPIAMMTGDIAAAEEAVVTLSGLATMLNTPFWQMGGRCLEGKLLIARGELTAGTTLLRRTLDRWHIVGWAVWHPEFLGALAEGMAQLGQFTEALSVVDRALASADRGGERWYVAELLRIKGELLLRDASDQSVAAAEDCFDQALDVARQHGALLWELRAALSLARLRVMQDRQGDARQLLAPVYDRFTKGGETSDSRNARAVLESLSSPNA
jgi:predicted ATPase